MPFDRKAYYLSTKKKQIDKLYYLKNKGKSLSRSREYRKNYKAWFDEYKNTLICEDCGFTGCGEAIDFHHPNGDKLNSVASIAGSTSCKEKVLEEIKKCKILCARCHRIEHWRLKNLSAVS